MQHIEGGRLSGRAMRNDRPRANRSPKQDLTASSANRRLVREAAGAARGAGRGRASVMPARSACARRATAIGLAAAIPAVVLYNNFISRIRKQEIALNNFNADFLNIVKRNFFQRKLTMGMGGGSGKSKSRATLSEINVTPLVDVMLVLLIMFMVTTP